MHKAEQKNPDTNEYILYNSISFLAKKKKKAKPKYRVLGYVLWKNYKEKSRKYLQKKNMRTVFIFGGGDNDWLRITRGLLAQ